MTRRRHPDPHPIPIPNPNPNPNSAGPEGDRDGEEREDPADGAQEHHRRPLEPRRRREEDGEEDGQSAESTASQRGAAESTRYSGRVERVDLSGFHLRGSNVVDRGCLAAVWPLAAVWLRAVADLKTCERVVPCACVKMCWMLTFLSCEGADFRPNNTTPPGEEAADRPTRAPSWRSHCAHCER